MSAASPVKQVKRMINAVATANAWRDGNNPLRGLTMTKAVRWLEDAQRGIHSNLQWAYETGIEITDADLLVIIDRSVEAVTDMEWQVEQISDDTRGFDEKLADEQEAFLRQIYEGIDNLYDAIAHLSLFAFRGFAHVTPWYRNEDPLAITELHPLDQWNMVRDGYKGAWAYDAQARQIPYSNLTAEARLDPSEYVVIEKRRSVNRIALIKYVRASVSEKNWDAYVEAYGLPGVFIVAPDGTTDEDMPEFEASANKAAAGGGGALPPGSTISTLSEVRSTQPFQPRLEWLQKQLVLAGTGGLLTVLTESGSGTLAGSVHEQAFRQLGRGRARRISEAFQRQIDRPKLALAFPGQPVLAYFELKSRQEKDTGKFVDNVSKLKSAGYVVDPEQISQETGYTITSVESAQPVPGAGAFPGAMQGKARLLASSAAGDRQAAAAAVGDRVDTRLKDAARDALAQAMAKDLAPLRTKIEAALALEDDTAMVAALKAIQEDMPSMLLAICKDPASQQVLEESITAALLNGFGEGAASVKGGKK